MKILYKVLHTFTGHHKKDCDLYYAKDFILDYIKCRKCGAEMGHEDFIL